MSLNTQNESHVIADWIRRKEVGKQLHLHTCVPSQSDSCRELCRVCHPHPNPAHGVWSVGRVWLRALAELPGEMDRGGECGLAARLPALSSFYLKRRDLPYGVAIRAFSWCVEHILYLQPSVSWVHVGWNRALHQCPTTKTPVWYFLPLECFFHFLPWWW